MPPKCLPELIDYVVDFLWDDPTTLANVALVSRDLHASASFHRFATISIVSDPRLTALEDTLRLSAPFFRKYVRALRLGRRRARAHDRSSPPPRIDIDRIMRLISMLPLLHIHHIYLGVVSWPFPPHLFPFPTLPEAARPPTYLHAVIDLTAPGTSFPETPIPTCTTLLLPADSRIQGPLGCVAPGGAYSGIRPVTLRPLFPLALSPPFTDLPLHHAFREIVAQVASLELLDAFGDLFRENGSHVNRLSIRWCDPNLSRLSPNILTMRAGIERLTSLSSLTLWTTFIPVDDTKIHLSQWSTNIGLLSVPAVRSVHTLAYAIVVDNSDYATSMDQVKTTPWWSLCSALEHFQALESIVVAIYETPSQAEDRQSIGDEVWELVYSSLYPLKERGIRLNRTSAPLL